MSTFLICANKLKVPRVSACFKLKLASRNNKMVNKWTKNGRTGNLWNLTISHSLHLFPSCWRRSWTSMMMMFCQSEELPRERAKQRVLMPPAGNLRCLLLRFFTASKMTFVPGWRFCRNMILVKSGAVESTCLLSGVVDLSLELCLEPIWILKG